MIACNGAPSSDKELRYNAEQYIQAMADYRVEDAKPYATFETQETTLDYLINVIMPNLDSTYIASNTPATITIDSIVCQNDTIAIVYYHKQTPLNAHLPAQVEMRLESGVWLAHQIIQPLPFLGMIPKQEGDTLVSKTSNNK